MLPPLAISESDLAQGSGPAPTSSGHAVQKINFVLEPDIEPSYSDLEGLGFLKYCDPSYSQLHAKYVVALSVLYRSTLGVKASQERLVYNPSGKIRGTVSVAIPNFVPMQKASLVKDDDIDIETSDLSNPTPSTLIDKNIAELLIANFRHKNDDLHPDNLSVEGVIDFDMCGMVCAALKNERPTSGLLHSSQAFGTILQAQDLDNFPILTTFRTHWPTHKLPQNGNILKTFQSQQSFEDLSKCDKFREQMFAALLKELLSFQPEVLTNRLYEQLGNETLNLDSLAPKDGSENTRKKELLNLIKPDFFYKKIKKNRQTVYEERGFIDHFMLLSKNEFDSFYKLVINYAEFNQYLVKNPGAYQKTRDFFESENEKYPEEQRYDLEQMDSDFQKIWRDSALPSVLNLLDKTEKFHEMLQEHLEHNDYVNRDMFFDTSTNTKHAKEQSVITDTPLTDEHQEDIFASKHKTKEIIDAIKNLHIDIQKLSVTYFKETRATVETNTVFIARYREKLSDLKTHIQCITEQSPTTLFFQQESYETLLSDWEQMLTNLDFQSEVKSPLLKFKSAAIRSTETSNDVLSLPTDIDKKISDQLILWLKNSSIDDIIINIHIALHEYTPLRNIKTLFWVTPCRTASVDALINDARNNNDSNSLLLIQRIFSKKEAGWKTSSLNTKIMKILLTKMLLQITPDIENASNYPSFKRFIKKLSDDSFLHAHILKIKDEFKRTLNTKQTASVTLTTP